MKRFILFWALLVWLATPAWAEDTNKYPATLIDQGCTDLYDAPTATTAGFVTIGGGKAFQPAPAAQTTGDPDGYCDNDSRILTGAQAADVNFGPFTMPLYANGLYIWADVSAVTGGDLGWRFRILVDKPHDGATAMHSTHANNTAGVGDYIYVFGIEDTVAPAAPVAATALVEAPLPDKFYIGLDLTAGGATSWTGEISMFPMRY